MAKWIITLAACLVLFALSACEASPSESLYSRWMSFKSSHGKQYASSAEEAKRLELFAENKRQIDEFNRLQSEEAGYTLAVNHMSDWTDKEFEQLLGFKGVRTESESMQGKFPKRGSVASDEAAPDSVDWRKSGRVSSVKDQGPCGSDWAFAAAGLLEGQEKPQLGLDTPIDLSAQVLMDCAGITDDVCKSGYTLSALIVIALEGGILAEKDYPYKAAKSHCKYNESMVVMENREGEYINILDEEGLKLTVSKYGPVAAMIEVTKTGGFINYKSGVFTDDSCEPSNPYNKRLNHSVLIVGYGTDPQGGDYWLVKNSWGASWGEEGYIRMARNKDNMCGIANFPVIATF